VFICISFYFRAIADLSLEESDYPASLQAAIESQHKQLSSSAMKDFTLLSLRDSHQTLYATLWAKGNLRLQVSSELNMESYRIVKCAYYLFAF
jgi:hypothetical protein